MANKFGMHLANQSPFDLDLLLDLGCSTYFGLSDQIDAMRYIRQRQPGALIVMRVYREHSLDIPPRQLARETLTALWDEAHATGHAEPVTWQVTPANELNINDEGGSSDRAGYQRINDWHLEYAGEMRRLEPRVILHFSALSPGHSEDQDDNTGFVGLDLCREAITAYPWFDDHAYWEPGQDPMWEYGGGRYRKKLDWLARNGFANKPVLITETNRKVNWGDLADRAAFASELVRWYRALDAHPQVVAGCYFLWRGAGRNQEFTIADKPDVLDTLRQAMQTTTGGTVMPNPDGTFILGEGVAKEIAKRSDTAHSDEQWLGDVVSLTAGDKGLYFWDKQAGRVYFLQAQ